MAFPGSHGAHIGPTIVTVSRDGDYIVRVHGKEVSVHSATPIEGSRVLRSIKLPEPLASQLKFVKISLSNSQDVNHVGARMQIEDDGPLDLVLHQRLLCATNNRISVWQLNSLEWHADIENIEPSVTAIDFGASNDEVILFHAWSSKVTVFNLESASSLIIKSPNRCARLKWSPDGRWIAIWDAASSGTKVLIYTADGQHFRTYTGRDDAENTHDLGVKCIEWAPLKPRQQNSEVLAVGKYDGTVDLLNTRTFSCSTTLSHTFHINAESPRVWRERMSPDGKLEYAEAASSSAFITAGNDSTSQLPRGISMLQFSPHGDFLATVDQTRPNIVWIWAMTTPPALETALVHEHNIKNMLWHSKNQELLIITANTILAVVHLWSRERSPVISEIPISRSEAGRYDITWVKSGDLAPLGYFWFSNSEDAILGRIVVNDEGNAPFDSHHVVSRGGLVGM
uniref:WD repeat-containing protein WRAP73 n=1 Tax=Talaromyces marneffei PM1 TaxID=1077442 RepID=A0A093UVV6_TALMA